MWLVKKIRLTSSPEDNSRAMLFHPLWFNRPFWLIQELLWPVPEDSTDAETSEVEERVVALLVSEANTNILASLLERASSFCKLLRVTVYIFRAISRQSLQFSQGHSSPRPRARLKNSTC